MERIRIPGQPGTLREGTYRINPVPLVVLDYDSPDSRSKQVHLRSEALMDIIAVVKDDGTEDTHPRAMWMRSKSYEQFHKGVELISKASRSGDGYDPHLWMVHIDEQWEVDFVDTPEP